VIDPVSLSVAGDSNNNSEVRRGLAPLVSFAQQCGAAVLGISHFSKGTAGKDPLDRVTGSLAFGAAPRLVLGAARIADKRTEDQPQNQRHVFVRIKSNIGPSGGAIAYELAQVLVEGEIQTSRIAWGELLEGSAREILAEAEQSDQDQEERSAPLMKPRISWLTCWAMVQWRPRRTIGQPTMPAITGGLCAAPRRSCALRRCAMVKPGPRSGCGDFPAPPLRQLCALYLWTRPRREWSVLAVGCRGDALHSLRLH